MREGFSMGWARTLLLGDIGNRLDIADSERDIQSIRRRLARARRLNRARDKSIEQAGGERATAAVSRISHQDAGAARDADFG